MISNVYAKKTEYSPLFRIILCLVCFKSSWKLHFYGRLSLVWLIWLISFVLFVSFVALILLVAVTIWVTWIAAVWIAVWVAIWTVVHLLLSLVALLIVVFHLFIPPRFYFALARDLYERKYAVLTPEEISCKIINFLVDNSSPKCYTSICSKRTNWICTFSSAGRAPDS